MNGVAAAAWGDQRRAGTNAVCPPLEQRAIPQVVLGGREQKGSPNMASVDTFKARRLLTVGSKTYAYYSLAAA